MRCCALLMVVALAGCGDDDGAAVDARVSDGSIGIDAAGNASDAAAGADGAVGPDAGALVDAAAGGDGADSCGTVGDPCTTGDTCGGGHRCEYGGGGSFCTVDRGICGGFGNATCDDSNAPICMYLTGSSAGVCVSAAEKECICAKSAGAIATACD